MLCHIKEHSHSPKVIKLMIPTLCDKAAPCSAHNSTPGQPPQTPAQARSPQVIPTNTPSFQRHLLCPVTILGSIPINHEGGEGSCLGNRRLKFSKPHQAPFGGGVIGYSGLIFSSKICIIFPRGSQMEKNRTKNTQWIAFSLRNRNGFVIPRLLKTQKFNNKECLRRKKS